MRYFTFSELTRSDTAVARNIDNTASEEVLDSLAALVHDVLDPLREAFGGPITVNSGYRCPALNRAVGGSPTSHHLRGCAADITGGSRQANRRIFEIAQELCLPFDQLIDERGYRWIHISHTPEGNRHQILHL